MLHRVLPTAIRQDYRCQRICRQSRKVRMACRNTSANFHAAYGAKCTDCRVYRSAISMCTARNSILKAPTPSSSASFYSRKKLGNPLTITSDGTQTRDFTHVSDIVRANLLAAVSTNVGQGEVINIGAGGMYRSKPLQR